MGRSEKQLDPHAGPLARLAVDLRELRRTAGAPTYREMSRTAGYSPSALSAAASGANLPSASVLSAYVRACGGDVEEWLERRNEVACLPEAAAPKPVFAATASPRSSVVVSEPIPVATVPEPAAVTRRHRFARRTAGLIAAAIVGSMATVVPMAVWGAPSCLTNDHAPAAHCQPANTR